jgi:hypothetical protein
LLRHAEVTLALTLTLTLPQTLTLTLTLTLPQTLTLTLTLTLTHAEVTAAEAWERRAAAEAELGTEPRVLTLTLSPNP